MIDTAAKIDPYYVDDTDSLRFDYHPGQKRIMDSNARFKLALAGTQSGKTVIGPWWLFREICSRGFGDYMVVAPSYPLMQKKALPEFKRLFQYKLKLGEYLASDRIFRISKSGQKRLFGDYSDEVPTQVFFGHAQDPDSLEAATAKAAWCDESGQKKFKYGSWEAIERRLSIFQGSCLHTTTPYVLGWLKNELHDKADGVNVDLIQFDSLENPVFPKEEYFRQQQKMPRWKFNMMYKGIFERPAGMIYDCFNDDNKCKRFTIPASWPRFLGLDFGGVNTVAVYLAQDPQDGTYYAYQDYKAGGKTAGEHAESITDGRNGYTAYGGSWSEDQWRGEFKAGGLYIHKPPIKDVEVGIDRVYSMLKQNELVVFDDLAALISDLESYSRALDDQNEPTEKIEDKETFHHCDALRYICSYLEDKRTVTKGGDKVHL